MDLTASLEAPCAAERLFELVDDLSTYPQWNGLVHNATREPDSDSAWDVELRARVGPLARSKRLRMVRTRCDAPNLVRFERREHDGRQHADWVLEAQVDPRPADGDGDPGSRLVMRLHYGGTFGGMVLERLLGDAIERSRPALLDRVS